MPTYYPRAKVTLQVLLEDFATGAGEATAAYTVVPRSVEIERNNVREADVATVEIDYRDLPLDPRTVRAILVAIFLGDAGSPTRDLDLNAESFQAFIGYVDEPETTLDGGGDVVRLTCRDYTSLFLDATWTGGVVDVSVPLTDVIARVLSLTPGAVGLEIILAPGIEDITLSKLTGRKTWTPKGAKDDCWTVLSDLCGLAGLIPLIDRDELFICEPARIGNGKAVMEYGRNVERMVVKRRLNEVKAYQVLVRAWDEQARTVREALHPPVAKILSKTVSKKGKVTNTETPILPFYLSGSYSEPQLQEIARRAWEDTVRSQIEGELDTREMLDLEDAELWTLGNGDLLEVTLGRQAPALVAGMSEAEAVATLTAGRNGLSAEAARLLVRSWRQAEAAVTTFYILSARHTWSREDGYSLSLRFSTYVGAR